MNSRVRQLVRMPARRARSGTRPLATTRSTTFPLLTSLVRRRAGGGWEPGGYAVATVPDDTRGPCMQLAYTPAHEALRQELRAYYDQLLTPEVVAEVSRSEGIGPAPRRVVRQMAEDGWLGIGWPKEFGGQGRGFVEQFIFFDESMRAGAPVPMLTINSVAPTIMKYGSEEQKAFFLPKILGGEIHFCIGYTEPDAGTDLASLRTSAVLDGDEWVINGQKIFTSLATDADYVW